MKLFGTPERHFGMILNIALNTFTAAQAAIKDAQ